MKKTNRKGFTIVELVIVIAVIAVLAAVLIPTFSGIIEKAHLSNDTSLVASINTAIAVEQIATGEPNDAIEIAKIIKRYGMKLETKSKGNYLWYDIENRKVVLAGLNGEGIVLQGENPNARAVDGKGDFKEATSPESFIEGYLFITESSKDGLADAIYALRNPEVEKDLEDALQDIEDHGNGKLYGALNTLMQRTAVMTKDGETTVTLASDKNSVTRVLVSAEMDTVKEAAINEIATYPNVIVVDFHSEVKSIAPEALTAIESASKIFFVYNNNEIKSIDKLDNLITLPERADVIGRIDLIYVDGEGDPFETIKNSDEFVLSDLKFTFGFKHIYHGTTTTNKAYTFVNYSLWADGSNAISAEDCDKEGYYVLKDDEKFLIKKEDATGVLTLYAVFKEDTADFKVGDKYYSSAEVTHMLAAKDENGKPKVTLPGDAKLITVVSTDATLGTDELKDLTIPAGVELVLPFQADGTKQTSKDLVSGSGEAAYNEDNYKKDAKYDKASMDGKTQLTITEGVTLNNQGSIYVDAQLYCYGTPTQCYITNNCGVLELAKGSKITSNGSITAYGVIRGEGAIDAVSGNVTEVMTVYDWYGGSNAATCVGAPKDMFARSTVVRLAKLAGLDIEGKGVVPFHSWKLEHIRVTMTVRDDVTYSAHSGVLMTDLLTDKIVQRDITFLLASNKNSPLFLLADNAVIEKSASENGNTKITIKEGKVFDTKVKLVIPGVLSISKYTIDAEIDFSTMSMPLSHLDVNIAPDTELTLSNNTYKVMPDSNITVEKGGTLNIATKVVACNSFDLDYKSTAAEVALPNNFYADVKAEDSFVVNGILNFSGNAAFAGNITSTSADNTAEINANVAVGGYSFPEGTCYKKTWYTTHDPNLHTTPVLNGLKQENGLSGKYTYGEYTNGSQTQIGWHK